MKIVPAWWVKTQTVISPTHPDILRTLEGEPLHPKEPLSFIKAREEVQQIENIVNDLARKLPPTSEVMLGGALALMIHMGEIYRRPTEIELVAYDTALPQLIKSFAPHGYHLVSRKINMHIVGGSKLDIYADTTSAEVEAEIKSLKEKGFDNKGRINQRNLRLVRKDARGKISPHATLTDYLDIDVIYRSPCGERTFIVAPDHHLMYSPEQVIAHPYSTASGRIHVVDPEYIRGKKGRKNSTINQFDLTALTHYEDENRARFLSFQWKDIVPILKKNVSSERYVAPPMS